MCADERPIDLDGVDLQPVQETERREAGAEVVEAPADAHRARAVERDLRGRARRR